MTRSKQTLNLHLPLNGATNRCSQYAAIMFILKFAVQALCASNRLPRSPLHSHSRRAHPFRVQMRTLVWMVGGYYWATKAFCITRSRNRRSFLFGSCQCGRTRLCVRWYPALPEVAHLCLCLVAVDFGKDYETRPNPRMQWLCPWWPRAGLDSAGDRRRLNRRSVCHSVEYLAIVAFLYSPDRFAVALSRRSSL